MLGNLIQHFQFDHTSLATGVPLSPYTYVFLLPYVNCESGLTFVTANVWEQWSFHLWIKFHCLLPIWSRQFQYEAMVGDAALLFAGHTFSTVSFRSCKTESFLVCSFNCSRFSSEIGNICSRGGQYQENDYITIVISIIMIYHEVLIINFVCTNKSLKCSLAYQKLCFKSSIRNHFSC